MNVLCFTGGGCFGYAQARVMECFDDSFVGAFAGTSIGAANALAAAADLRAHDVSAFFRDRAPEIFAGHRWRKFLRAGFAPRYNDAALNRGLQDLFGDLRCNQLGRPVVVVTHDLHNGEARVWHTPDCGALPVWKLARMSMGAQTYFDPFEGHSDGGLFDNDPCLAAVVAMLRAHRTDSLPLSLGDLRVFSLGSGANFTNRGEFKPRLLSTWLRVILNDTLDCGSVTLHRDRARTLLQTHDGEFVCFEFPHSNMDFDDAAVVSMIDARWMDEMRRAAFELDRFFNLPPAPGPGTAKTAPVQGGDLSEAPTQ